MMTEPNWAQKRARMVRQQLQRRGIKDQRILAAMAIVPRHEFVPKLNMDHAYHDGALPIGVRQTISQPYIVAAMSELLAIAPGDKVLEVGTGSGYQAAVLAQLGAQVITVERHAALAERARVTLARLGYTAVKVEVADGSIGWAKEAPYAGIVVTAAAPEVPPILLEQMVVGGRLVIPVGDKQGQVLQCWRRTEQGYTHDDIFTVRFVPLRGDAGWSEEDW